MNSLALALLCTDYLPPCAGGGGVPGGGAGGCGGGGGVGVEGAATHQQEHQTLRGQARPARRGQGGS